MGSIDDRRLFWSMFDNFDVALVQGAKILEVGCGAGERAIQTARLGAREVVGVDICTNSIDRARAALEAQPEDIRKRVRFFNCEISNVPDDDFDIAMSEDALEHIIDVAAVLAQMHDRLRVGGNAMFSFGPLFHSPYGDHSWMRAVLPFRSVFIWPWGHLIMRDYALKKLSERHGVEITNTINWPYLVLNGLSVDDYLKLFDESKLELQSINYNPARSALARAANLVRAVPGLSKYLTWTISARLMRTA